MAVEVGAVEEEVDPTRMAATSSMTSLEIIIQGTTITVGEGAVEVVGPLTTTTVPQLKMAITRPTLELHHDNTVSFHRMLLY